MIVPGNNFYQQLKEQIRQEVSGITGVDVSSITDDQDFSEFGLDSLMAIELESRLQHHLKDKCQIAQGATINCPSINALMDYLKCLIEKK